MSAISLKDKALAFASWLGAVIGAAGQLQQAHPEIFNVLPPKLQTVSLMLGMLGTLGLGRHLFTAPKDAAAVQAARASMPPSMPRRVP